VADKSDPTRIVVVDDHPLYRQGVVSTLAGEPDMEVVGEGASADEALALCRSELPELALLDVRMPGTGMEAARQINKNCPATKIVMLTVSEDDDDVVEAFRAGARAYILKGVSAKDLTAILRAVHAGEVYVPQALASRVLVELSTAAGQDVEGTIDALTDRERQILERVASGDSNKEIGYDLGITEKTVKHYMTNILQKLHARNRVEAALLAHEAGLGDYAARKSDIDRG
jgi:two-component system, NarL family, nitrate/nitrite response regulator NarL